MSLDARIEKRLHAVADSPAFELNVHIRAGSGISVLFGPSGAGKTLTLNCIAGFAKPDAGRIMLADRILFDAGAGLSIAPDHRRCGYLFQDHALFPHMSVRENLHFAASVSRDKQPTRARHKLVQELLEAFEITDLATRRASQLSGGQRQRAALARVLASRPGLLLLDEPTRGLDGRLKESFYAALEVARERLSAPVLLITHDVEECIALPDRLFVLQAGRIVQEGSPEEVVTRPASVEVARLFGLFGLLEAEIRTLDPGRGVGRVFTAGQDLETPYFRAHLIGDRGWLCVREPEISLRLPNGKRAPDELATSIEAVAPSVTGMRLRLACGLTAPVTLAEYDSSFRSATQVVAKIPHSAVSFLTGG